MSFFTGEAYPVLGSLRKAHQRQGLRSTMCFSPALARSAASYGKASSDNLELALPHKGGGRRRHNLFDNMLKRLLIADDHELVLAGISQILSPQFEIVGVASDGCAVVDEARRLSPDIIVLDLQMPGLNGVEATRQIAVVLPVTKIVMLTQQLSGNHVRAAFRAGVHGYVAKQAAAAELIQAVEVVSQGHYFVTSLAVPNGKSISSVMDVNPAESFGDPLTARQREVLGLVAKGKATKEIAAALNISVKTVDFHKGLLMDELGLRSTAELTRYAISNGLTNEL